MSDVAIRIENVGKKFRIGRREPYLRLSEAPRRIGRTVGQWLRGRFAGDSDGTAAQAGSQPDEFWALRDVSLEVKRGEVLGVIGRNGAGKSTLLKILSRITRPTTGQIELFGRVGSLLEVGTGFHPELTGRENIFLNGTILGMRRAEIARKFDEIVAFAEIEQFLDTPVKHYSSGMYMRLAFAVAAHLEPEILLVDEVLAVGDLQFQKKCVGKMGEISRGGRTVLFVSHNLATVVNLCSHAVLVREGRIAAKGQPGQVIQEYLAAGQACEGEVVWPDVTTAPGNDIVRLRSLRILHGDSETPADDVDISCEVQIEITYRNLVEGTPLYAGIWLKDQTGVFVLSSHNAHSQNLTRDGWYATPCPAGVLKTICRIPGSFLNEGRYYITPLIGRAPSSAIALESASISFTVHDTGAMCEEYKGSWAGPVIRPRLAWNTEYLGPEGL